MKVLIAIAFMFPLTLPFAYPLAALAQEKGGTSESNQAVNAATDPGTNPKNKPARPVKKTHIQKDSKGKLPTSSGSTTSGGE